MRVSVIIPTLNESANIGRCLASVLRQTYADKEIIVADGGSSDDTQDIARSFGAKVILNPQRVQDVGKMLALKASTGDIILMLDADNELVGDNYIERAVACMVRLDFHFGIESTYHSGSGMTAWNRYLTELLHISDPVSWLISRPPTQLSNCAFYLEGAWPLGANGFFYRRRDLERAGIFRRDRFEDCAVAMEVSNITGSNIFLRLAGCGVRHYHSKGPCDFIAKRKRQAFHYLRYRAETNCRWLQRRPRMSVLAACFLCVTLVHPIFYALWKLITTRRYEWLWHPVASVCSVLGLVLGVVTYARARRESEAVDILEASLQPER